MSIAAPYEVGVHTWSGQCCLASAASKTFPGGSLAARAPEQLRLPEDLWRPAGAGARLSGG